MAPIDTLLSTHPTLGKGPFSIDSLAACIQACADCAVACDFCADACLSEPGRDHLERCIRLNGVCAQVCSALARVGARGLTTLDRDLVTGLVLSCSALCAACAQECETHAQMHEHCRLCAEACRRCEIACAALAKTS